jgi:hypothetical protein
VEAVVAHGSRMSWAGILRPGDEFPRPVRSQLAVVSSETGSPLERYFGAWSEAYHRFTANLTTAKVRVRALKAGEEAGGGIWCVLHWVRREDMVGSGKGSVRAGDGWPKGLWDAFVSELDGLDGGTVAQKLQGFLRSDVLEENEAVSGWREEVGGGSVGRRSIFGTGWLPVPAELTTDDGDSNACVVSWSPGAGFHGSLSEALGSPEGGRTEPDEVNQAKYYAECMLGGLHGVRFDSPGDHLEDAAYALRPEVRRAWSLLGRLERRRIADPALGLLDRFGG